MQLKKSAFIFAVFILAISTIKAQTDYYDEISHYSDSLYRSLDKLQKRIAGLSFGDTARLKWNNLPVGLRARAGLSIGNMTIDQRKLVHRILSASLSSQGYLKATSIMHLDDLLNRYYDSLYYKKQIPDSAYHFVHALLWTHRNYFFAFFGEPGDSIWGYKLEGHHLSINFTFTGHHISVTPFFIGTDPAEYPNTEYAGWRVLGQEEDLGIKFIHMLGAQQKKEATMSTDVPGDIITAAESGRRLVEYWGIKGDQLTPPQKRVLEYMIREFVYNMEYEKATAEYEKIVKAGIDSVYFGWIGEYVEGRPHYYIINGPTFLIEFDNNGGPARSANHIHTIWREKGNEYGEDVLRQHYLSEKH